MSLQKQIIGAQATLGSQLIGRNREEERLAHYQKLAEGCVVMAPRGFLVYANRPGREPRVFLGASVQERMPLFTLPDLSKMEVQVMLHETAVDRVRPGMAAHVQIDALAGPNTPGTRRIRQPDAAVRPESESANRSPTSSPTYSSTNIPAGLRPGMTAATSILCTEGKGVLTVPMIAVSAEDGRNFCYVSHEDRIERRPVKVLPANHDSVEVIEGLNEGEVVALEP